MKKAFLSIAIVITMSVGTNAQINLIGASTNSNSGNIDLIQWQALDSLSVNVVPTILDGYYFATSAFDALNSIYYITGISDDSAGLYSYNSVTSTENLVGGSLYTNISEFDMSNGKMYNLIMETEEYISIYEYNISSNQDSLIGIIYEPGAIGIVSDAIGFDSNSGILYYVGFTNDPALCLYTIPVRDSLFSFTKTILNTTAPYNNITSVNFDNVNEILYALNDTYDSLFNFTGRNIIEVDKITGDIINRGELIGFPYYVGGSSSFDQNTGTFLVVGIDTGNMLKMIAFNTYSNTYVSGFVPDLVSEIVCDNSIFAKGTYLTTGVKQEPVLNFKMYPNPVSEILSIEYINSGPVSVQIFSSLGKQVFVQDFTSAKKVDLDLESLSPGLYLVNLISREQTATEKILVH
jgi:hypothetical protein